MASSCTSRKVAKITLWISIPLLVVAIACVFIFNALYAKLLSKQITLAEGTLVSELWKDIPLPIYERIYFFNITNEGDFLDGEKLNVVEVGPYTYKARWIKPNPVWPGNSTVSYREIRTYEFIPELSNGTEDDLVYTLNAPLILAANFAKGSLSAIKFLLYLFLLAHKETLVTRKSIRQLVYEGYEDAIIKDATYVKNIPYKDGRFSWLYGKNASDDGLFSVFTGEDDASKTNFISSWNGEEQLSFWKGESCNAINGSTSIETGPPIETNIESYTFFQSIFCRSLTFDYSQDTSHRDIPAKRFKPSRELLANSTENPENACFEVNREHASGVLDVSPCQFGAPAFISFPHFHLGDESYLQFTEGLRPNESVHGSHLDVEPVTGMSVDISVKFQINLEIENDPVLRQFHRSRNGVYPVLWVDLGLSLDEKMADFLKTHVNLPKVIAYSVIVSVCGLSLLVIVAACLVLALSKKRIDCLLAEEKNGHGGRRAYSGGPSGDHLFENHAITRPPGDAGKYSYQPVSVDSPEKKTEKIYPSLHQE